MLFSGAPRDPRILKLWFSALTAPLSPVLHLCTLLRVPGRSSLLKGAPDNLPAIPTHAPWGSPERESAQCSAVGDTPQPTSNFQGKEFRCGAGRN